MSTKRDLQVKIDIANNRLNEMEHTLGKKHNAVKIAKKSISQTTGRKQNKFFVPRNATDKQLAKIERAVDALLASSYSTPEKRTELRKKQDSWIVDALGWNGVIDDDTGEYIKEPYEYTQKDLDTVYNVLGSRQFQRFKEMYIGTSDLEIEIIGNIVAERHYHPSYIKGMLTRYMKKAEKTLDRTYFE